MTGSCRIKLDGSSIKNDENCFLKNPNQNQQNDNSVLKLLDQVVIADPDKRFVLENKSNSHPYFADPGNKKTPSSEGLLTLMSLYLTPDNAVYEKGTLFSYIELKSPQELKGYKYSQGTRFKIQQDSSSTRATGFIRAESESKNGFLINDARVKEITYHTGENSFAPDQITLMPDTSMVVEIARLGKVKITTNEETKIHLNTDGHLADFTFLSDVKAFDFELIDQPDAKFQSFVIDQKGRVLSFKMKEGSLLKIKDRTFSEYDRKKLLADRDQQRSQPIPPRQRTARSERVRKFLRDHAVTPLNRHRYEAGKSGSSSIKDEVIYKLGLDPNNILVKNEGRGFYSIVLTSPTEAIGGFFQEGVVFYAKYEDNYGRGAVRLHRITHEDGKLFEFGGVKVLRVSFYTSESRLTVENIVFPKGVTFQANVDELGEVMIRFNEETYVGFSKKGLLKNFQFKSSENKMKITLASDPTKELSRLETKTSDGKLISFGVSNGTITFQGKEATGYTVGNEHFSPRVYNVNEKEFGGFDCESIEHVEKTGEVLCRPAGDHVSLRGKKISGVELSQVFQIAFDEKTKKVLRIYPRGSFIDVDGIEYPSDATLPFDPETGERIPFVFYPKEEDPIPSSRSFHEAKTIKDIYWQPGQLVHVHQNGMIKEGHPQKQKIVLAEKGNKKYAYKANPEDTIYINEKGEIVKVVIGKETIAGYLDTGRRGVRYSVGTVLIIRKGEVYEQ